MDYEERKIFEERGLAVPSHLQDLPAEEPVVDKGGGAGGGKRERRRRQRLRRRMREKGGVGVAVGGGDEHDDGFYDDSPEESERNVEEYFDPVIDPDDSRESQEGELRGYMVRQPLNAPHYIRSGRKRYNEDWFRLRDEIAKKPGREDIEEAEDEKQDEVTRLLGYDELPEDVEYLLHGKQVSREEYKRKWKQLKREGRATEVS